MLLFNVAGRVPFVINSDCEEKRDTRRPWAMAG